MALLESLVAMTRFEARHAVEQSGIAQFANALQQLDVQCVALGQGVEQPRMALDHGNV